MEPIQVLFKEYETLRTEVISRISHWYQLAGVAAVVAGWMLTHQTANYILYWSLLGVATIVFAVLLRRDIHICSLRLRQLESEINSLAGQELLKWHTHYGASASPTYFWRNKPR
ncbi:MAG: hypothetical protein JO340_19905 [Acidobacteriaceae bacterium]|nr:hypothetical protein [Acidobacteriaceae bacterium]